MRICLFNMFFAKGHTWDRKTYLYSSGSGDMLLHVLFRCSCCRNVWKTHLEHSRGWCHTLGCIAVVQVTMKSVCSISWLPFPFLELLIYYSAITKELPHQVSQTSLSDFLLSKHSQSISARYKCEASWHSDKMFSLKCQNRCWLSCGSYDFSSFSCLYYVKVETKTIHPILHNK